MNDNKRVVDIAGKKFLRFSVYEGETTLIALDKIVSIELYTENDRCNPLIVMQDAKSHSVPRAVEYYGEQV
jgi:hypothetical protein